MFMSRNELRTRTQEVNSKNIPERPFSPSGVPQTERIPLEPQNPAPGFWIGRTLGRPPRGFGRWAPPWPPGSAWHRCGSSPSPSNRFRSPGGVLGITAAVFKCFLFCFLQVPSEWFGGKARRRPVFFLSERLFEGKPLVGLEWFGIGSEAAK